MAEIRVSGSIAAPIDQVWRVAGSFGDIAAWVPPIQRSSLVDGSTGSEVGAKRQIDLDGGVTFVETQIARSDEKYTYSYSIPTGVLPMQNYEATVTLAKVADGTEIEWSSSYDPDSGAENDVAGMIQGVYESGIQALKERFGD